MSTYIQGKDADDHIVILIEALNRKDWRAAEEALNGAAFVSHYAGLPTWKGMENLCHVCRTLLTARMLRRDELGDLVAIENSANYDPSKHKTP